MPTDWACWVRGGRGTASYFGLEDQVDVYMGTFSKSLASLGGYMAASEEVAEYVRHASRPFIFSASIPPANCATALAALRHLEQHPELVDRLRSLSLYARKGMTDRGLKIRESALNAPTPIIPIYTYETYHTLEVAKEIYDRGVYVNPTLPRLRRRERPCCGPATWPPTRRPCWTRPWTLWRRCW